MLSGLSYFLTCPPYAADIKCTQFRGYPICEDKPLGDQER